MISALAVFFSYFDAALGKKSNVGLFGEKFASKKKARRTTVKLRTFYG